MRLKIVEGLRCFDLQVPRVVDFFAVLEDLESSGVDCSLAILVWLQFRTGGEMWSREGGSVIRSWHRDGRGHRRIP